MINNQDLPIKCQSCFKAGRASLISRCQFCRDLSIPESVLCDLNRTVQSSANEFYCHAFQPMLNMVIPQNKQIPNLAENGKKQNGSFLSDKTKYQIALYLQKLNKDPDFIFAYLKYHVFWNVFQREKAFPESPDLMESVSVIFKNSIFLAAASFSAVGKGSFLARSTMGSDGNGMNSSTGSDPTSR